jgi:AcrR family transcriptional regulator
MKELQNPTARRRAGRPSRLSRELVITAALELLDEMGIEQFSVTKLGKRLDATAMSIYTYFPSRDALLEAAADHLFALFTPPAPEEHWQDYILAWLVAVTRHFERFPVSLQVLAWDEHISASWLRAWLPALRALHAQQPDLKRLAVIADWFLTATIGFIYAHLHGPKRLAPLSENVLELFDSDEREILVGVQRQHANPDEGYRLEFEFQNIVAGLEVLISSNSGKA